MLRRIAADAAVGASAGAGFALIVVLGDVGGFGRLAASGGSTLIASVALAIALASSWGAIAAAISIFLISKKDAPEQPPSSGFRSLRPRAPMALQPARIQSPRGRQGRGAG